MTSGAVAALQVTLFIGNLTQEWRDEQTLHTELSKHGRLERLFIAKAADGSHKVISTCHVAEHCRLAFRRSRLGCGALRKLVFKGTLQYTEVESQSGPVLAWDQCLGILNQRQE